MNDIFTNLYNKVLGFFRKVEAPEENSKDIACNRLRVVLMQDRTNLTPELLERMRSELVELLSKYLEMDKDALELNLEHDGEQMALALSIPVIRAKDEEEIEAAIKEAEEAKAVKVEEETSDDGDYADEKDMENENSEVVNEPENDNDSEKPEDIEKVEDEKSDNSEPEEAETKSNGNKKNK